MGNDEWEFFLLDQVLQLHDVGKYYTTTRGDVPVLEQVSLTIGAGASHAILGPSGSGKTTLLSVSAGLDTPYKGQVTLLGKDLAQLDEERRARLRNEKVGFVFQSFHLMASLTALENVMLPLELLGQGDPEKEARELLGMVGLGDRLDHYPTQLSGGEQQRVAISRAFINRPQIMFADEPTGNLDRETSERITELLFQLNQERQTALLLITHDQELAKRTDHVHYLREGRLQDMP